MRNRIDKSNDTIPKNKTINFTHISHNIQLLSIILRKNLVLDEVGYEFLKHMEEHRIRLKRERKTRRRGRSSSPPSSPSIPVGVVEVGLRAWWRCGRRGRIRSGMAEHSLDEMGRIASTPIKHPNPLSQGTLPSTTLPHQQNQDKITNNHINLFMVLGGGRRRGWRGFSDKIHLSLFLGR